MTDRDKTINPAGSPPGSPPGSALRRRMIEDMTVRKLAPKTQATYTTMAPWPPRPATSQGRQSVDHHRGREVPSMPVPEPGHGRRPTTLYMSGNPTLSPVPTGLYRSSGS